MRNRLLFAIILVFTLLVTMVVAYPTPTTKLERMASERLICQIDFPSLVEYSFEASPDSQRVAYVAQAGDEQLAVIDGEEGKR